MVIKQKHELINLDLVTDFSNAHESEEGLIFFSSFIVQGLYL
jgi:hypothetical protein